MAKLTFGICLQHCRINLSKLQYSSDIRVQMNLIINIIAKGLLIGLLTL